ncbi:MAG: hypothetical protein IIW53_08240 [Rikenellaceae bacterium]|nr:hypothetical protein [Rikenellaceae bacterium]
MPTQPRYNDLPTLRCGGCLFYYAGNCCKEAAPQPVAYDAECRYGFRDFAEVWANNQYETL